MNTKFGRHTFRLKIIVVCWSRYFQNWFSSAKLKFLNCELLYLYMFPDNLDYFTINFQRKIVKSAEVIEKSMFNHMGTVYDLAGKLRIEVSSKKI